MEPVGFAISVVSLAALFESCVDAFDRVNKYRQHAFTSRQLQTRFQNQKFLLTRWGARVGITVSGRPAEGQPRGTSLLDDQQLDRIQDTLARICEHLNAIDRHFNKGENDESTNLVIRNKIGLRNSKSDDSSHKIASRIERFKWATGGKERIVELVESLETMVQGLRDITDARPPSSFLEGVPELGERQGPYVPQAAVIASIRSWLGSPDSSGIREQHASSRTPGTCQWIFALPEYEEWLLPSSGKPTLWLYAPPGCGKSVIAATLAGTIQETRPDCLLLAYFCSATQESLRAPTNILRSCLAEAISRRPKLSQLAEMSKVGSYSQLASEDELWSLFAAIVKAESNTIIIIDGFDECHEFESDFHRRCGSDRAKFLRRLHGCIAETSSHLAILSRDEDDIRTALNEGNTIGNRVIEYAVRLEDVKADVKHFAASQVENSKGLAKRNAALRDEIIQHLISRSDGMFLWVRLQSLHLTQAKSVAHLRHQMTTIPIGLDNFYERDWTRIRSTDAFECDRTQRILRWVTFAARPLTPFQLFEAIAIERKGSRYALSIDSLPEQIVDDDLILSTLLEPCRPFVALRESTAGSRKIQLAHFTMRSFLVEKLRGQYSDASSDLQDAILARVCVGYLSQGLASSEIKVPDTTICKHPLASYVVQNWVLHLNYGRPGFEEATTLATTWFSCPNSQWYSWRDAFEEADHAKYPHGGGVCYYAAWFGLLDLLKACHVSDSNAIHETGGFYGTALQVACLYENFDMVSFLIEAGAEVNARAGHVGSALGVAALKGNDRIIRILLDHHANARATAGQLQAGPLHYAAIVGKRTSVRSLIDAGAQVNDQDVTGHTALLLAVKANDRAFESDRNIEVLTASPDLQKDYHAVVKAFLEAGADVDVANKQGCTPILYVANSGNDSICKLLLAAGADVSALDRKGHTALHLASRQGHANVVELLLNAGADPLSTMADGLSPIDLAALGGHTEILRMSLTRVERDGSCQASCAKALMFAASRGYEEMVRLLLKQGTDSNIVHDMYVVSQYVAIRQGHERITQLLSERALRSRDMEGGGLTLLHCGANFNNLAFTQQLLDQRADVTLKDRHGWTPWMLAKAKGNNDIASLLSQTINDSDVPEVPQDIGPSALLDALDPFRRVDTQDGHFALTGATKTKHRQYYQCRANHPMRFSSKSFYYEMTVLVCNDNDVAGLGICAPVSTKLGMPGWRKDSYGYHSDDGKLFSGNSQGRSFGPTYGTGDIVGCGGDQTSKTLFFTKNGQYLGKVMYDVQDRLFAVVGVVGENVEISVNFGSRPFAYQAVA